MTGAEPPPSAGRYELVHEPDTGILVVRFHGLLTADLALQALDSYTREEDGFESSLRLWDLRDIEIRISAAEIQAVARHSQERDTDTPGRLALLVADDLGYGLARVHQAFRESETTAQKIFRDEERARAWLLA